jgi:hypothetical protein
MKDWKEEVLESSLGKNLGTFMSEAFSNPVGFWWTKALWLHIIMFFPGQNGYRGIYNLLEKRLSKMIRCNRNPYYLFEGRAPSSLVPNLLRR